MIFQAGLGKVAPAKKCMEKKKALPSTNETVTWEYSWSLHGVVFKRHSTWHSKKSGKFTMTAIGSSDVFMVPASRKPCAKAVGEGENCFEYFVFEDFLIP